MQLNRLYSNLDDLFTPVHFNAAKNAALFNVIFAEVKQKRSKLTDSHNLGKTTLIALIDFMLLKDVSGDDHFLSKHKARFHNFIFYMEIAIHGGGFVTVRRSVADPTAIALKRTTESIEDARKLAPEDWDHWDMTLTAARQALDAYLHLSMVKPIGLPHRRLLFPAHPGRLQRIFPNPEIHAGQGSRVEPYLAGILGLDHVAVSQKYEIEDKILEKTADRGEGTQRD